MAKEIERKFLVNSSKWKNPSEYVDIKQGYLVKSGKKVVRVRIAGNQAFLTIKGNLQGITRDEFEYSIPISDAQNLLAMCEGYVISKRRYYVFVGNKKWEVDFFKDENSGLCVAEIELESEDEKFEKPLWAGDEVSTDQKYFNFNLSSKPFSCWQ
jgi:CYTH domain-containing protein